jgi:hypothetical protein
MFSEYRSLQREDRGKGVTRCRKELPRILQRIRTMVLEANVWSYSTKDLGVPAKLPLVLSDFLGIECVVCILALSLKRYDPGFSGGRHQTTWDLEVK